MKVSLLLPILGISISSIAQNPMAIPPAVSGPTINLDLQTGTQNYYTTPTNTMGANGDILGPTLMLNRDDSVEINVTNNLPDSTTVHWHGLHVSPENDGGPHSIIPQGDTWTKSIKILDHAATYWYHPHLHHKTNEHVTKGIAGFIFVRDAVEQSLTLPRTYGVDEFPVVVQSRSFDQNDQFTWHNVYDTTLLVNGTKDAYLDAPAQVVRVHLLNGSSERAYNFGLSNNQSFHMIASDGGLLDNSLPLTRLLLAPGERAEILVDLTGMQGQQVDLMSYASEIPNGIYGASNAGMGGMQSIPNYTSNPLNGNDFVVLPINVVAQTANPVTTIPSALTTNIPYLEANANNTRTLTFSSANPGPTAIEGPFLINGTAFDMNVVNDTVILNDIEVWTLTNNTPISHPFHIHDVQFYILDIGGAAPPAHQAGRKDVVLVEPMTTVRFIAKFDDFASDTMPYMYHCHMLTHEDDGMMGQFIVIDTATVGVNEIPGPGKVVLYPNPSNGNVSLSFEGPDVLYNIEFIDVTGRVVKTSAYRKGQVLNVNDLSTGSYYVRVTDKQDQRSYFTGSLVVRVE